jgi:hypothetical protein
MSSPLFFETLSNLLNEPHYKSIGKVAANWAALEALVNSALWRVARVEDMAGACFTAQIPNMARRVDALAALVKLRGGSTGLIKKVNKFGTDTHGLNELRNRVVHDPWHVDRDTGEIKRLEVSAKGSLKLGYVAMPVAEIDHVVDLIHAHINRFDGMMKEIWAEIES